MKKLIYLFLAVTMTAFLFGCGEDNTTKDNSNDSGNTPVCKNGVVCPEEQPKTNKGQTKELKLTFTNATGKGNKLKAEIDLPDANMFKFNLDKGKCDVLTLGTKVLIERSDNHNETPICDVYYTFTAPQDANVNTNLTGKYVLFSGDQAPAPTESFTVKHPLVVPLDGLIINPAPQGNVITNSPTTDGTYTLTFTNENQPIPDTEIDVLYFQFDVDLISTDVELIKDKTTCRFDPLGAGKQRFYQNLRKTQDSCKITYRLNGSKKDMILEQFVTKRIFDQNDTEPDMSKAQKMTVKHP